MNADTTAFDVAGLHVIHKHIAGEPIITASILFDRNPDFDDPVIAHAQYLAMQLISWWGSQKYIDDWDEQLGALGATHWSTCSSDYAHTGITAPAPHFDAAWHMLASAVLAPPFAELSSAALDSIKSGYRQSFDTGADDADAAAALASFSLIADGHPYNIRRQQLDVLARVEPSTLQSAWEALRVSARMTIVIVGDIERDRVAQLVGAELGDSIDQTSEPSAKATPALRPSHARADIVRVADAPSWQIYGYFPAPPATDEAAFAALELGSAVLSRRLFDHVRDELGLVYSIGITIHNFRAAYGTLSLSTIAPVDAMQRVRESIDDLLRDGIDDVELESARARYLTQFEQNAQSSYRLAITLGDWQLTAGDRLRVDTHLAAIRGTTASDATAALSAVLPGLRIGAAGPDDALDEQELFGAASSGTTCQLACNCLDGDQGQAETCNGNDDDCDGKIDEGVQNACGSCGELSFDHCPNHHTLFITSRTFAPTFGSLEQADQHCQELAMQAGRDGTWRALLADRATDVPQREKITKPVFNTRQELVAADSGEFWSGQARNAPSADENGAPPSDTIAWVGSSTSDCQRWTSSSANDSAQQASSADVKRWLVGDGTGPCSLMRSLYCIDQD